MTRRPGQRGLRERWALLLGVVAMYALLLAGYDLAVTVGAAALVLTGAIIEASETVAAAITRSARPEMTFDPPAGLMDGSGLDVGGQGAEGGPTDAPTTKVTVVVAGNFREACEWARMEAYRGFGLWSRGRLVYANPVAVHRLYGLQDVEVVRVGTWQTRSDLGPVEVALRTIRAVDRG